MNFLKITLAAMAMVFLSYSYASAALACNPKCKKGYICRYDSTKKPDHYCSKNKAIKGGTIKNPSQTQGVGGGTMRK